MAGVPEVELTAEQRDMPPEWLKKDAHARIAEGVLKAIDPDVAIEWVQGDQAKRGTRKLIQLSG